MLYKSDKVVCFSGAAFQYRDGQESLRSSTICRYVNQLCVAKMESWFIILLMAVAIQTNGTGYQKPQRMKNFSGQEILYR